MGERTRMKFRVLILGIFFLMISGLLYGCGLTEDREISLGVEYYSADESKNNDENGSESDNLLDDENSNKQKNNSKKKKKTARVIAAVICVLIVFGMVIGLLSYAF